MLLFIVLLLPLNSLPMLYTSSLFQPCLLMLSFILHPPPPAMSYPSDDPSIGHHTSAVRSFLDERHPSAYLMFNLSDNRYDPAEFNNQVQWGSMN